MQEIAGSLNEKYGVGTVEIEIVESYYNMREKIKPCMQLIEYAKKAAENADIVPDVCANPRGNRWCKIKLQRTSLSESWNRRICIPRGI